MNKKSLFLLASSMFLLASCGGGGNQDVEETLVTGVKLSSYSIELKEGDAAKAIAYRVDGRGEYNKEVTVASENASVCTVALVENQNQFTVAPVAFGETKINVVSKGDSSKAASLSVKVEKTQDRPEQPHVTGISVSPENERILIGEEVTFTVSLTGVGDFDRTYSVNNEHPDVVTVLESNGDNFKVKALAEGTALIDVISNENSAIAKQVQILVDSPYIPPEVDKVELATIKKDVELGETFDLAVTSATGDVSWSLDPLETTIISLSNESNTGVTVTANAIGSAKVVASVGSAIAECVITVPESKLYGGYAIKLNDGEELPLNKVSTTPEGMLAQYTYSLTNVSAGTVISFFGVTAGVSTCINETVGANGDDPEHLIQNNLKQSALGDFVVLKDIESEAKNLYFEVYDDRCGFWLEGGPELEINTPMLVGLDGQFDTGIKLSLNTSSEFEKEYYVKNVHVETSQEFKFRFNNYPVEEINTWAGYEAVEEGCRGLLNDGGEPDHNMSVKEDGYYDFYWKLVAGTIWVNKVEEPAPEYNGFMAEVDGIPFDLDPVSPTPEGMKAQYTLSVTAIAGSKIDFYGVLDGGSELIDSKISPNGDDVEHKLQNNLKPATAGGVDFKVLKDCTDATLYFEVYESGFGFWLEGGPDMLSGFYLKVNGQPAHQLVDDGEIEGGYHQYKALSVALAEGDKIELFDADHDASWMCELQKDAGEYAKFNEEEGYLEANTAGTYDFYVKMKSGEDLLYIGETPSTDPSITFKASSYNVVVGNEVTVEVETENCGDAEVVFSIEEGFEYAELKSYSENNAVVIGAYEGDAKIRASVNVKGQEYHAEATIHVLDENIKSVYFHNPYTNFTDFSLYLFKGETHNADWPGEALSGTTYSDKTYGDCYKVDIDLNTYDTLILTAKEEGEPKQTRDIALSELGEKDLVMFDTDAGAWKDRGDGTYVNDGIIATFTAEVAHEFTVSIDEETPVPLTLDEGTMPAGVKHQWSTDASLDAGAGLEFTMDGEEFTNITLDPAENNNAHINLNDLICVNNDYDPKEGDKSLYLKELTDGTFVLFVAGGETPVEETYSVVISNKSKDPVTKELTYKEDTEEYYLDNIELSIHDVLEFYKGDEKLDISPKEDAVDSANNATINLGTTDIGIIRHVDATKGKGIFLDPEEGTVWVDGNHVSYSIIAGYDSETDLTYKGEGEGYVEYTFKFDEIEDGETIVFFKNGLAINVVLDTHEGNNAKAAKFSDLFDCCDVIKGGKNLSVYLKVYTDPAKYEVWVGEAKGEEPESYTITVNLSQDWIYNDSCCVWAWVWGEGNTGKWIKMNNAEAKGTTITFDVPAGTTGMKFVRASTSTDPSTLTDFDSIGNHYNDTKDYAVSGSTTLDVEF